MAHIFFSAATGVLFQLFMGSGHFCKCLVNVSNFRCFASMSLSCRNVLNASGWKKDMNLDKKSDKRQSCFFPLHWLALAVSDHSGLQYLIYQP